MNTETHIKYEITHIMEVKIELAFVLGMTSQFRQIVKLVHPPCRKIDVLVGSSCSFTFVSLYGLFWLFYVLC